MMLWLRLPTNTADYKSDFHIISIECVWSRQDAVVELRVVCAYIVIPVSVTGSSDFSHVYTLGEVELKWCHYSLCHQPPLTASHCPIICIEITWASWDKLWISSWVHPYNVTFAVTMSMDFLYSQDSRCEGERKWCHDVMAVAANQHWWLQVWLSQYIESACAESHWGDAVDELTGVPYIQCHTTDSKLRCS